MLVNYLIMIPLIIWTIISDENSHENEDHLNPDFQIVHKELKDDGIFPNNTLPVILYKKVIDFSIVSGASVIENIFQSNGWGNSWRNGIYSFHHYHSTAHEVLGSCSHRAVSQARSQ